MGNPPSEHPPKMPFTHRRALLDTCLHPTKTKRAKYMREEYRKNHKQVNCTLTKKEFRKLKKHAEKAGYTPTEYLCLAAFAYTEKKFLSPESLETELQRTRYLILNIADNINQIAHHTNRVKNATLFDLLKARKLVYDLEELIRKKILNPPLVRDHKIT